MKRKKTKIWPDCWLFVFKHLLLIFIWSWIDHGTFIVQIRFAPPPEDIYWENLNRNRHVRQDNYSQKLRKLYEKKLIWKYRFY